MGLRDIIKNIVTGPESRQRAAKLKREAHKNPEEFSVDQVEEAFNYLKSEDKKTRLKALHGIHHLSLRYHLIDESVLEYIIENIKLVGKFMEIDNESWKNEAIDILTQLSIVLYHAEGLSEDFALDTKPFFYDYLLEFENDLDHMASKGDDIISIWPWRVRGIQHSLVSLGYIIPNAPGGVGPSDPALDVVIQYTNRGNKRTRICGAYALSLISKEQPNAISDNPQAIEALESVYQELSEFEYETYEILMEPYTLQLFAEGDPTKNMKREIRRTMTQIY